MSDESHFDLSKQPVGDDLNRLYVLLKRAAQTVLTPRQHRLSVSVLFLLFFIVPVFAHEVRPAYLQLRQTSADTYDAVWKVPGAGENLRLGIYVGLPKTCGNITQPRSVFSSNAYVEEWSFKCPGGLNGATINITGLSATMTDVLVRLERLDGTTLVTRLTPSASSFVVSAAPRATEVAKTYLQLGVQHILTGWDHLLYIVGMLLLVRGWKRVIATMSAFTATHSLTLTGAALGWVHVPQRPVEACIALSILFVASEGVRVQQGRGGLTQRWPWIVSFSFGLLHGFGFAGALSEVGLPQKAIPVALLFFNLGVEVGQLVFIAALFAILIVGRELSTRTARPVPSWARRVATYAIGTVAAFWFIQRVGSF